MASEKEELFPQVNGHCTDEKYSISSERDSMPKEVLISKEQAWLDAMKTNYSVESHHQLPEEEPRNALEQNILTPISDAGSIAAVESIDNSATCSIQKTINDCKEFINWLKKNWSFLKQNIDAPSFAKQCIDEGLIRKDEFNNVGNNKRSIMVERILIRICERIENAEDTRKLEKILEKHPRSLHTLIAHSQHNVSEDTVSLHRELLQESDTTISKLDQDEKDKIKDCLLECGIISLDENEKILNAGKQEGPDKVLANILKEKVASGSYDCLRQSLKTIFSHTNCKRGTKNRIKRLQKELKFEQEEQKQPIAKERSVEVAMNELKLHGETSAEKYELHLDFKEKDEPTGNALKHLVEKGKGNINMHVAKETNKLFADNVTKGSVIIHLRSLDQNTKRQVKNLITNGKFDVILSKLFSDPEILTILSPGRYTIEMKVCPVKSLCGASKGNYGKHRDILAANKAFLIEEIDAALIGDAFKRNGIDLGLDGHKLESRDKKSEYVIDKIIAGNLHDKFREILRNENLTYIHQRLITYDRVYNAETPSLSQCFLSKLRYMAKTIDLDYIRDIFVERNIFPEDFFDKIEEKFSENRELGMATVLTDILQSGKDAMLTFIDALFMIQLDSFANELLLASEQDVVIHEDDTGDVVKLMESGTTGKECYIEGTFHLIIKNKEDCTSTQSERKRKPDRQNQTKIVSFKNEGIPLEKRQFLDTKQCAEFDDNLASIIPCKAMKSCHNHRGIPSPCGSSGSKDSGYPTSPLSSVSDITDFTDDVQSPLYRNKQSTDNLYQPPVSPISDTCDSTEENMDSLESVPGECSPFMEKYPEGIEKDIVCRSGATCLLPLCPTVVEGNTLVQTQIHRFQHHNAMMGRESVLGEGMGLKDDWLGQSSSYSRIVEKYPEEMEKDIFCQSGATPLLPLCPTVIEGPHHNAMMGLESVLGEDMELMDNCLGPSSNYSPIIEKYPAGMEKNVECQSGVTLLLPSRPTYIEGNNLVQTQIHRFPHHNAIMGLEHHTGIYDSQHMSDNLTYVRMTSQYPKT